MLSNNKMCMCNTYTGSCQEVYHWAKSSQMPIDSRSQLYSLSHCILYVETCTEGYCIYFGMQTTIQDGHVASKSPLPLKIVSGNLEETEKLLSKAQTLTHSLVIALEGWKSAVEQYRNGDVSPGAVNASQKMFSDTFSQLGLIMAPSVTIEIDSSLVQGIGMFTCMTILLFFMGTLISFEDLITCIKLKVNPQNCNSKVYTSLIDDVPALQPASPQKYKKPPTPPPRIKHSHSSSWQDECFEHPQTTVQSGTSVDGRVPQLPRSTPSSPVTRRTGKSYEYLK